MREYEPLIRHYYHDDAATVIDTWTTAQWEHHRNYLDDYFLKMGAATHGP